MLTFEAEVWPHSGEGGWHFVTVPADVSDEIRDHSAPGGFGSVRVTATIGGTTWQTSVFPQTGTGCYVLPVRRQVRDAEDAHAGAVVRVRIEVA